MFSRFFIERPIFASVISIFIVIAGLVTLAVLPVAQYPEISPPTVQVTASYPGANARVVADTVASPIEQQVNGVEGMIYMSSTCANDGSYKLTVTFEVGTDMDMATVLVQNRVAIAMAMLPEEVKRLGVTTKKQSTNIVLMIALTGDKGGYDDLFLSNFATLRIKDELARLEGVGDVFAFGSGDYAIRLWLDPAKLKARKLTAGDVLNAIREQNVQVAAGQIGAEPAPAGQNFQYVIRTQGRLEDVAQFENIIIKTKEGGRILRVRDVAKVELGSRDYTFTGQFSGKPTAILGVYQLPGANALELADRVREKMKELSASFPPGLEYHIPLDTTIFVRTSIKEVVTTLFIAVTLVFLTIWVFLQDWRTTLIPALTIPVSLIGTFTVMGILGFSINTLTLFGIILAIGIVVDDAIVVVENTSRNLDQLGLSAREAAIKAMEEVSGAVIATTLVLLSVFIPTAFLGGITGELYRQFALTISISTVFSTLNALTLSPALCAIILRPTTEKRNWFSRGFEWVFGHTSRGYNRIVGMFLRKAGFILLPFAAICVLSYLGFIALPTGFLPIEDQGYVLATAQLPDAASLQRTRKVVEKVNRLLQNTKGVENWLVVPGYSVLDGSAASNAATFWITLDPWEKRETPELSLEGILGRLTAGFQEIQEAQLFAFAPPSIPGLGVSGGFQMELQDRGGVGLFALQQMTNALVADANTQSGLSRVYTTFRANTPQIFVEIDRVKAKTMDVPLTEVFGALQTYLGSAYINDFNKFGRTFQVHAQAAPDFRSQVRDIQKIEVRSLRGKMIPLGTLLTARESFGPQTIKRYNLYPAASINGDAAPGYSSGQALTLMESLAKAKLSPSFGYEWTGMSFQEKISAGQAPMIFALAVLFVYLVLCAQYENWSIPWGVILAVPLAVSGTVIGLMVRDLDFNAYTQIGMVLLVALASKNAILIVEFAKDAQEKGRGAMEAASEAADLRFRPILMTAFSSLLGMVPLVFASGAGAASRIALGTAVFSGMITATVLTIFFVPSFYVVIQRLSKGMGRIFKSKKNKKQLP